MQAPDPIEAALARLMPVAFSDGGLRNLEETLDTLAAESPVAVDTISASPTPATRPGRSRFLIPSGIAASIAALLAMLPEKMADPRAFTSAQVLTTEILSPTNPSGLILVSESERIESMTDEGWLSDPDGTAMQAVRVRTIGENQLRDEQTGIEFRITEPREEILLMPVSSF